MRLAACVVSGIKQGVIQKYSGSKLNARLSRAAGIVLLLLSASGLNALGASSDRNANWPQWRGPLATGAAPSADPPLRWSETENLQWKIKIPGSGTASPIVWEEKVFILTAIPTGKKAEPKSAEVAPPAPAPAAGGMGDKTPDEFQQFVILCYDRANGKELWRRIAREEIPHEGHNPEHGYASASPMTDGELVWAYFGSRGLHCYDLAGNLKWSKDLGRMKTRMGFGEGASPALHGNTVVIYWDDETDNDFIAAFDKQTGKELWRTPRNEATGWSTPLVVEFGGKAQVIVNATGKVRSYDLATGKEIWSCAGQTANSIPTPVASVDTVFVTSGFRGSALYAIALGQTGDLAGTAAIRWTSNKNTPYVPSPLLTDDLLYFASQNNAVISCLDAKTGAAHFQGQRLEALQGIYASPVTAKGRVYVLGRNGTCVVLKKGSQLEVLATNSIADKTDASIALAGRELFIRGHQWLYCFSK